MFMENSIDMSLSVYLLLLHREREKRDLLLLFECKQFTRVMLSTSNAPTEHVPKTGSAHYKNLGQLVTEKRINTSQQFSLRID